MNSTIMKFILFVIFNSVPFLLFAIPSLREEFEPFGGNMGLSVLVSMLIFFGIGIQGILIYIVLKKNWLQGRDVLIGIVLTYTIPLFIYAVALFEHNKQKEAYIKRHTQAYEIINKINQERESEIAANPNMLVCCTYFRPRIYNPSTGKFTNNDILQPNTHQNECTGSSGGRMDLDLLRDANCTYLPNAEDAYNVYHFDKTF